MAPALQLAPIPPSLQLLGRDLQDMIPLNGTTFKCDGSCAPLFIKTVIIIAGLWMYAGLMYLLVEYGLKIESKRENSKRKMGCRHCQCCFAVPIPIRALFVALLPPVWSCIWTTDTPDETVKRVADLESAINVEKLPKSPPKSPPKDSKHSEKMQKWFQQEPTLPKLPPTPSPRSMYSQTPSPPPAYQSPGRFSPSQKLPEYASPAPPPRPQRSPERKNGAFVQRSPRQTSESGLSPAGSGVTRPRMAYRAESAESARSNQALLSTTQKVNSEENGWLPVMYVAEHGTISEARRKRRDEIERGVGNRASVDSLGLYVDLDGDLDRRAKDIGVEGREFF